MIQNFVSSYKKLYPEVASSRLLFSPVGDEPSPYLTCLTDPPTYPLRYPMP